MADKPKLPNFKKDYIGTEQDIDYSNSGNLNKGVSWLGVKEGSLPGRIMNFLQSGALSIPIPGKTKVLVNESAFPRTARVLPGYDPLMMEHERVHAGQFKLRDIPPPDDAKKLLLGSVQNGDDFMDRHYGRSARRNDAFEVPATALTSHLDGMDGEYREKVYDYLDDVYQRNPDNAALFEAYLPDRLVKQYIQDRPRPYPKTELQKKLGSW